MTFLYLDSKQCEESDHVFILFCFIYFKEIFFCIPILLFSGSLDILKKNINTLSFLLNG